MSTEFQIKSIYGIDKANKTAWAIWGMILILETCLSNVLSVLFVNNDEFAKRRDRHVHVGPNYSLSLDMVVAQY